MVTKTDALRNIGERVTLFSQLGSEINALVPGSSEYTSRMRDCYGRIFSTFRESVIEICQLTSEDDALNFIEGVVSRLTSEIGGGRRYVLLQNELPARIANDLQNIADSISKNNKRVVDIPGHSPVDLFRDEIDADEIDADEIDASKKLIGASIGQLDAFKWEIMANWPNDDVKYISFANNYRIGDDYHIGDIINASGIAVGPHSKAVAEASLDTIKRRGYRVINDHDTVVARLADARQPDLALAVSILTEAVLASPNLTDDYKESRVKQLNIIGQEVLEGIRSNASMG